MQEAGNEAMNMIFDRLADRHGCVAEHGERRVGCAAWHAKRVGSRMGEAKAREHPLKTIGALRQEDLKTTVDQKLGAPKIAARAKNPMQQSTRDLQRMLPNMRSRDMVETRLPHECEQHVITARTWDSILSKEQ